MTGSSEDLIRHLIELSGGAKGPPFLLALEPQDLDSVPAQLETGGIQWTLCRPRTELSLRRFLWKAGDAHLVALVDASLAGRLPPDLVRRARKERVMELGIAEHLALALGVPVIPPEDALIQGLVMRYAGKIQQQMQGKTLPTVVDAQLLDEYLTGALLEQDLRAQEPGALLAKWIQKRPQWPGPDVLTFAQRMLERYLGLDGRLLGWALEVPSRLEDLVVHGALLEIDEEVPNSAWGPFLSWAVEAHVEPSLLRKRLVELAKTALAALGDNAAGLLTVAENRGRRDFAPKMLARSSLLPLGLDNQMEALAAKLGKLEDVSSEELSHLYHHRAADRRTQELQTLEEMSRLVRYVHAQGTEARPERLPEHVFAYQRSGAFADLSASKLRRLLAASHAFFAPARRILERWCQVRDEQNLAFAQALRSNYSAALKADGIVPLHLAWTEVALKAKRPLYVILLDGCSYPVFLELLDALSEETPPIGIPTLELRMGGQPIEIAAGEPALAPLPTITSHARSAFFLGSIPNDPLLAETVWRDEKERTSDPGRFNQNGALKDRKRQLFLKRDLADGGEALTRALANPSLDVVAAVFNAVDDQIGSANTGAFIQVTPRQIAGFLPALKAALQAGRQVLVTADHGHTPFVSLEGRVGEGGTARFRDLSPGESAPPGFLEIDVVGTGGTPGRKAFAWKMGAYQGGPQAGFHGGCSLEEMVIPLAWLERDGVPADEPTWWQPFAQVERPHKDAKPRARRPQPVPLPGPEVPANEVVAPSPQPDLFPLAALPPARGGDLLLLEPAVLASLDSTERAALQVVAENASVRLSELARKVGRQPARFSGLLTQLNRKLHQAQSARFKMEQLPDGETLVTWTPPETNR